MRWVMAACLLALFGFATAAPAQTQAQGGRPASAPAADAATPDGQRPTGGRNRGRAAAAAATAAATAATALVVAPAEPAAAPSPPAEAPPDCAGPACPAVLAERLRQAEARLGDLARAFATLSEEVRTTRGIGIRQIRQSGWCEAASDATAEIAIPSEACPAMPRIELVPGASGLLLIDATARTLLESEPGAAAGFELEISVNDAVCATGSYQARLAETMPGLSVSCAAVVEGGRFNEVILRRRPTESGAPDPTQRGLTRMRYVLVEFQ